MIVEVEANDNCEVSLFARFKAGPPRQVHQVRLYDRNPLASGIGSPAGLTTPRRRLPCLRTTGRRFRLRVGASCVWGIYGLRFKPVVVDEPWSLDSSNQWGRDASVVGNRP